MAALVFVGILSGASTLIILIAWCWCYWDTKEEEPYLVPFELKDASNGL